MEGLSVLGMLAGLALISVVFLAVGAVDLIWERLFGASVNHHDGG